MANSPLPTMGLIEVCGAIIFSPKTTMGVAIAIAMGLLDIYIYNPTASFQPSLDVSIFCSTVGRCLLFLAPVLHCWSRQVGGWSGCGWCFFFKLYRKKMEKTSSKYEHHLPVNHIMWEKMVNHLLIPCYFCRKSSSSQLPLQNSEHGERARSHGIAGRKSPRSLVCSKIQGTTTMRR